MNQTSGVIVQIDWLAIISVVLVGLIALITAVWTISVLITKAFNQINLQLHGLSVTVSPYGQRLDTLEDDISGLSDRLSRLDAMHSAKSDLIDQHQRQIEALQKR